MANNKLKKPKNFKGIIAVLWTGVVDRNPEMNNTDYDRGDVIGYFEHDDKDEKFKKLTPEEQQTYIESLTGLAVWDDPRFEVVFIKDKTKDEMLAFGEPLEDAVDQEYKVLVKKRKFSFDLEDVVLKDKAVWENTDTMTKIKEKNVPTVDQPPIIEVP